MEVTSDERGQSPLPPVGAAPRQRHGARCLHWSASPPIRRRRSACASTSRSTAARCRRTSACTGQATSPASIRCRSCVSSRSPARPTSSRTTFRSSSSIVLTSRGSSVRRRLMPKAGSGRGSSSSWSAQQPGVQLRPASDAPAGARGSRRRPSQRTSCRILPSRTSGRTRRSPARRPVRSQASWLPDHAQNGLRVMCARRLQPATGYWRASCRRSTSAAPPDLNQPLTDETLQPAWLSGDRAPSGITLPVYCSWEFRTSDAERFRSARAAAAAARAAAGGGQSGRST